MKLLFIFLEMVTDAALAEKQPAKPPAPKPDVEVPAWMEFGGIVLVAAVLLGGAMLMR